MKGDRVMQLSDNIKTVRDEIADKFHPQKMLLFSQKHDLSGNVKGFKICIVIDTADKLETEKQIYLDVDSEVPYDVLLYTPEEWQELLGQSGSFAMRIMKKGQCIYGEQQTP